MRISSLAAACEAIKRLVKIALIDPTASACENHCLLPKALPQSSRRISVKNEGHVETSSSPILLVVLAFTRCYIYAWPSATIFYNSSIAATSPGMLLLIWPSPLPPPVREVITDRIGWILLASRRLARCRIIYRSAPPANGRCVFSHIAISVFACAILFCRGSRTPRFALHHLR